MGAIRKFRPRGTKNGRSSHPTYSLWKGMHQRCRDSKNNRFHLYGGRGIKVCERWISFDHFLADMGERPAGHSLDRIDPNGDYSPENCRWASAIEQGNNRRNNRKTDVLGTPMTLSELAAETGIGRGTLATWYTRGVLQEKLAETILIFPS